MNPHLDSKKEQLLKAVVKEYIHTASPVASLVLGGHYGLEASSATLRNWMNDLENLGYLKQPHASSGRVPTDQGYRHYVDTLMDRENLSPREKRLIRRELESGVREIEDLVWQAAEIISTIGKCTAVVLPPVSHNFIMKSLQLVRIDTEKILMVILTESGLVLDRVIDMECSYERLQTLAQALNERLSGSSLFRVDSRILDGIADHMIGELLSKILSLISDTVAEQNKNRVVVEGTHHLLDHPEFRNVEKFRNTLEVFKRENRLGKFLGKLGPDTHIFIGYENPIKDLQEFSVISSPYGTSENWLGTLALVGPTRMDYDHLVPLIQYTSSVLSDRLQQLFS